MSRGGRLILQSGETTAEIAALNASDEFVERAFYTFENRSNECHIEHPLVRFARLRDLPRPQNFREYRCSRNPLSLAVALNCGIGSSSLNADVNALDRLHSVRALNSSYCGLK